MTCRVARTHTGDAGAGASCACTGACAGAGLAGRLAWEAVADLPPWIAAAIDARVAAAIRTALDAAAQVVRERQIINDEEAALMGECGASSGVLRNLILMRAAAAIEALK